MPLITEQGRRFAETGGQLVEVVVAGAADVPAMIVPELEGVYVVGTGGTGVAQTFFTLGIAYFLIMLVASFFFRVPAEGWRPDRERESPTPNAAAGPAPSRFSERVIARLARINRRRPADNQRGRPRKRGP